MAKSGPKPQSSDAKAPEPLAVPEALREEWDILTAGVVDLLPEKEFLERLVESHKEKRPIRIKLGCDPSAPDLHVGHMIVINKLRQFQQLGHQVIFIVGDFTARIGDPTGKSETRKALSVEETNANAETYLDQLFKILDPEKTEVVRNSEWFDSMTMNDVIKLASRHTVARMLERDDFAKRYAEGRAIHIHEFLYPLVQGYDSIMVKSDIELGGTDQKFNLLVGRELMHGEGMRGQCVMTMPLLVGLDGVQKMSKSLGNAIGITEEPKEIYGKAMSVPDKLMHEYFLLVLAYPPGEVDALLESVEKGDVHPRELKARMARELVERYYSAEEAGEAEAQFNRVHREREAPEEIETVELQTDALSLRLTEALVKAGVAESKAQAKRLIQQGGVKVDEKKAASIDAELTSGEYLLQVGKRHFRRIRLTCKTGG